jgi:hypothetical protein
MTRYVTVPTQQMVSSADQASETFSVQNMAIKVATLLQQLTILLFTFEHNSLNCVHVI